MNTVRTSIDIENWVAGRVAYYLERPSEQVDADKPLAAQGFDSVFALALCGDIEDEFDLVVDPTLAWDYPTVAAIAQHIGAMLDAAA